MADAPKKKEEDILGDNILRIADELVGEVEKTKKYILIMIVAIIVAIPLSWHVTPLLLGTPYNFELAGVVTILVALAFIVIGIRQWAAFSKWTERYKAYKELQKKIDAKLDFESQEEDAAGRTPSDN